MDHCPPPEVIAARAEALLLGFGRRTTADHSRRVAGEARRLAEQAGADPGSASTAAWLHDISAVFTPREQLELALECHLEVLPEEREYPAILHQRLSAVLASDLFGIAAPEILTAISYHTTLRANAAQLDLILYVADKLAWDQADAAPYEERVRAGLATSLEAAALAHLSWMHERRASLRVVHPRLREAYEWLSGERW